MNKLESMWYHKAPKNGPLASSHIAVTFCALVKNKMIVPNLLDLEFDGVPKDFSDRSLSPLDYCLAYTDGVLFDEQIKAKYREAVVELFDSGKIYHLVADEGFMYQVEDGEFEYTLKCTWRNVDILADWLQKNIIEGKAPLSKGHLAKIQAPSRLSRFIHKLKSGF